MTKFEDQLYEQLMTEHGHRLHDVPRPAPARRRVRRPVWLAAGAAGTAGAVAAAVMALGSAPALAAYSVTQRGGTVTVAVNRAGGVAGANATLHKIGVRVVVVPVRPGCPPIGSLPHPRAAPHSPVSVLAGVSATGHRIVKVRVGSAKVRLGQGGIPAGATMILAFSGGQGNSLGEGGLITGPVPRCVSLPSAP
jgi:hypothetical protein